MDEGKKKRSYAVRGCYEQKSNYGEMYDKNEQRHEMPEVGDKVIILENTQLERTKNGVVAKYTVSNSYVDAHGNPEVFEVIGFSKGRDNALMQGNSIQLYRPFEKSEGYGHRTDLPCLRVAIGNVKLVNVESENVMNVLDELALNNGLPSGYGVYGNGAYNYTKKKGTPDDKEDTNT